MPAISKKQFPKDFFNIHRPELNKILPLKPSISLSPENRFYERKITISPIPEKNPLMVCKHPSKIILPKGLEGNSEVKINPNNLALLHQLPKLSAKLNSPIMGNVNEKYTGLSSYLHTSKKQQLEYTENAECENDESLIGESKFIACNEDTSLKKCTSIEMVKKIRERMSKIIKQNDLQPNPCINSLSKCKETSFESNYIKNVKKEKQKKGILNLKKHRFSEININFQIQTPKIILKLSQGENLSKLGRFLCEKSSKNKKDIKESEDIEINDLTFGNEEKK